MPYNSMGQWFCDDLDCGDLSCERARQVDRLTAPLSPDNTPEPREDEDTNEPVRCEYCDCEDCECATCDVCEESIPAQGGEGCCESVCNRCTRRGQVNHYHCVGCQSAVSHDDSFCRNCEHGECCTSWNENCSYCENCEPAHVIQDYSSKEYPAPRPRRAPYRPFLYLGVELEVECPSEPAREVAQEIYDKHQADVLLKHDGSLIDGFEMVTGKYELAAHQAIWPMLCETATKAGARSWKHQSTGLHVHLSREFFTPLTLGKFLVFINSERNRQHIIKLAGRESNGYSELKKKKINHIYSDNRYEAVNLTNDDTIEVRIFKGTLKQEHVLADIEFCHAVAYWCKDVAIPDLEDWNAFTAWVIKRRKTYKYLSTYFKLGSFVGEQSQQNDVEVAA